MPSPSHPQAKFDPIPSDLDLSTLVEKTNNFDYVIRISTEQIAELGLPEFEKLVLLHVIVGGKPLVVEGWQSELPPWLFSPNWLEDNVGKKQESVRDIGNSANIPMTIGHYLSSMDKLTKQWTPKNFREPKRQRLYLKDIDCPEAWHQHLKSVIPQILFYLNECIGEKGGPGASRAHNMYSHMTSADGIAPAGDLMSNLPPEMRAENMMCYIGHEGTYTPAHREMCATLGQNIMVETSEIIKGEQPGSSIWFMTESKDREVVSEYFLSMLGHDIEVENHFAQINAWKKAPFPVYIVEQKVGDFILIPPLAPHQVWNRGTRTMKVAWNRTTVETLEMALHEALPRARMVCRDEQYKCKAIIYYSLDKYYRQLKEADETRFNSYGNGSVKRPPKVRQLQKDFKRLFALYTEILVSEMFSADRPQERHVEYIPFDSNITCSYCRCNIFNRFLTCKTCIGEIDATGEEDTYDICMDCYAMGRSCGCLSGLQWVEQWKWPELTKRYEEWRAMVISIDGCLNTITSPQPLEIARQRSGKKSIAQVCQEQLKLRPWVDITKPVIPEPYPGESDNEPEVDDEGRLKKKKVTRKNLIKRPGGSKLAHLPCHICKRPDLIWKTVFCTTSGCDQAYCYGTLWRAFDMRPEKVMEDPNWKCPKCLKICSCGQCRRRDLSQKPYQPKGTLLGHDTKKVADPRSVESLVDFSRTNLAWLREDGDEARQNSQRMQKLMEKAQAEKSRDEVLVDEMAADVDGLHEPYDPGLEMNSMGQAGNMAIDPAFYSPADLADHRRNAQLHVHTNQGQAVNNNFTQHFEHTAEGIFIAQSALWDSGDSAYPDPSGLGRDRMMGIGYYQQANDADRILFDAPGALTPSPIAQDPSVSYPKLAEEPEISYTKSKRRKRESMPVANGRVGEAHIQFLEAQKKQKLNEAKKNGTYYITWNQLEGGQPLKVAFSMKNHKEFLQQLADFDEGKANTAPRHNPRPARNAANGHQANDDDNDAVIIESDVLNKANRSVYHEDTDDETFMESIITTPATHTKWKSHKPEDAQDKSFNYKRGKNAIEAQKQPRKRARSMDHEQSEQEPAKKRKKGRWTSAWLERKNAEDENEFPEALPAPMPKRRRRKDSLFGTASASEREDVGMENMSLHQRESVAQILGEAGINITPTPVVDKEAELEPQPREEGSNPIIIDEDEPVSLGDGFPVISDDQDDYLPFDRSLDAFSDDESEVPIFDNNYNPMALSSRSKSTADGENLVDQGYQNAKWESLRMAEAELEEEQVAVKNGSAPKIKRTISPVADPAKKGRRLTESTPAPSKMLQPIAKSTPASTPKLLSSGGKFMSMKERLAQQGKTFKIVGAKSSKPSCTVVSAPSNQSKPVVMISQPTKFSKREYMATSISSDDDDDDDEEIPAVRPVAKARGRPAGLKAGK